MWGFHIQNSAPERVIFIYIFFFSMLVLISKPGFWWEGKEQHLWYEWGKFLWGFPGPILHLSSPEAAEIVQFGFFLNYLWDLQPNFLVNNSRAPKPPHPREFAFIEAGLICEIMTLALSFNEGLLPLILKLKTPKCWSWVFPKSSGFGCKQSNFPIPDKIHLPSSIQQNSSGRDVGLWKQDHPGAPLKRFWGNVAWVV